jgi:hypothetical protein
MGETWGSIRIRPHIPCPINAQVDSDGLVVVKAQKKLFTLGLRIHQLVASDYFRATGKPALGRRCEYLVAHENIDKQSRDPVNGVALRHGCLGAQVKTANCAGSFKLRDLSNSARMTLFAFERGPQESVDKQQGLINTVLPCTNRADVGVVVLPG